MCFVSVVHDEFGKYVPPVGNVVWPQQGEAVAPAVDRALRELAELVAAFRQAVEAARTFDRLTGQPDCVDPEKAKLEERVAGLEAKLAAVAEAVR